MARQKILIVDDSRTIRMQVKDMLPQGNFTILEAKDGVEGFEIISQERPNLVLIDFFMPRMNGWEVVQKMQTFPKLQPIPIVMMSGRREDVEKAVPELFDYFEFVGKPFEQKLLLKAIKAATSKAKQRYQTLKVPTLEDIKPAPLPLTPSHPQKTNVGTINHLSETEQLKAMIQQLQAENTVLKTELKTLKHQVTQMWNFIQKRKNN
ncbi:MAG TPA: response regulator [Crinalium sp.]